MFFKANFRKATLVIIIGMASILPIHAFAIGLGEIQLHSSLNEPLDAEIQLLQVKGLSESDILVGIAPKADFEAAGVDRLYFLSSLKFSLELSGSKGPVVRIKTDVPVREPYLNFLLQVQWPSGRLLREYTLLMDISSLSDSHSSVRSIKGTEVPAEPAKPKTAPPPMDVAALEAELAAVEAEQAAQPIIAPASSTAAVETQTAEAPAASSAEPEAATPAPAASEEQAAVAPVAEEQPPAAEIAPAPGAGSSATAAATESESAVVPVYSSTPSEGDYTVQKGDNLWSIAMKYRQTDTVSIQQSMLAIQRLNPDAFSQGNINLLKKGKVLRLPSYDDLTDITSREAVSEVRRQNVDWSGNADGRKAAAEQIDATYQAGAADAAPAATEEGHLKLSVPGSAQDSTAGKASGAEAGSTTALQNELSIAMEELDRNKREKAVVNDQIASLNDQANTMKQMLDVRSAELAALQAALAKKKQTVDEAPAAAVEPPAADAQPVTETPAVEPVTSVEPAASVDAAPEVAPQPAAEEAAGGGLLAQLQENLVWIAAGLVTLLVLVFAAVKLRNRKAKSNTPAEEEEEDRDSDADMLNLDTPDDEQDDTADALQDSLEMDDEQYEESPLEAKPETSDAIGEADIYISFGTYDKAESLLKNAINSEPKRTDLRLKLLEVYVGMENLKAFDKQLEELNKLGERGAIERAREMRNRISGASDTMSNAPTAVTAALPEENNLDFDLDLSEDVAPVATTDDLSLDFDLDLDLGEELQEDSTQKSPKVNISDAPTVQQRAIDISEMKTAVTPAVRAAEAQTATRESIDLDLSSLDAELEAFDAIPDDATSTAVYEAVANDAPTPKTALDEEFDFLADADEAATKLDLARAYIDMGDKEGAKDILEEVIEEGQDAQKNEARKLLAGIS